jgi:class 3 adenylate cyclase
MHSHEEDPSSWYSTVVRRLWAALFSLKFAVIMVIVTVAAVCSTVAFVPLYNEATDAAEQMAMNYMQSVSSDVNRSVSEYFHASQAVVSTMAGGSRFGGFERNDTTSVLRWLGYGTTLAGADLVSFIFDLPDPIWTASFVSPTSQQAPAGAFFATRYNTTHGNISLVNTTTLNIISQQVTDEPAPFRSRPYYPIIRSRQGWGMSFIGIVLGTNESVLPCGAPLYTQDGVGVGAVYLRTRQQVIQSHFVNISIAQTGQAMLVDPQTALLVASTSALDPVILPNGTSFRVPFYTDLRDPLLSFVVGVLGPTLFHCVVPCSTIVGEGDSSVYVMVTSVNDTYGLEKRLVIAVPSEDFLGEIRKGTRLSIILTTVATAVLLVAGTLAVVWVTSSLDTLRQQLQCTKTLEGLDNDTSPQSLFTEIHSIEVAFDKLRVELKKMRSFLPQSVLELVGDSVGSDEESVVVLLPEKKIIEDNELLDDLRAASTTEIDVPVSATPRTVTRQRRRNIIQDSLNMECVLVSRRVTVVASNFKGFHELLQRIGPMELHAFHSQLLSLTVQLTKEHFGVIQSISGDHFVMSWNAATHRRTHISAATQFVVAMQQRLRAPSFGQRYVCGHRESPEISSMAAEYAADRVSIKMVFGLATGVALCGNFGCDAIKQPGIIGPVVQQAFALNHQCVAEQAVALMNEEASKIVNKEFALVHWNYVMLPQDSVATLISLVLGPTILPDASFSNEVSSRECSEGACRRLINSAFEEFSRGKFDTASNLVQKAQREADSWMLDGICRALRYAQLSNNNKESGFSKDNI